jgi:hemin uptake protein HemP
MALESLDVSKYRAIMTTTDRERITGEVDAPDEKRYQSIHRVRSRIEELEQDAEILAEHHPELYDELHEAVCDEE